MTTQLFVARLRNAQIKLWAVGDQLHFSAPAGRMTPELKSELQRRKQEILSFLREADTTTFVRSPIKPVSRAGPLPLSFSQQHLWFLNQLEPDAPFYNNHVAVRFEGM